jgi:hypothetical protein
LAENWGVSSLFELVKENAGMPEHYRLLMNEEYKKEVSILAEINSHQNLYLIS